MCELRGSIQPPFQPDDKKLCPLCGKSVTYSYQLHVHMAMRHKGELDNTEEGAAINREEVICDQVRHVQCQLFDAVSENNKKSVLHTVLWRELCS